MSGFSAKTVSQVVVPTVTNTVLTGTVTAVSGGVATVAIASGTVTVVLACNVGDTVTFRSSSVVNVLTPAPGPVLDTRTQKKYDFGAGADAPAAGFLAAPGSTTQLGTALATSTAALAFPIQLRSEIYGPVIDLTGLDPGTWEAVLGLGEWYFIAVGSRSFDIAINTTAGTVVVARNVDPYSLWGQNNPQTLTYTFVMPATGAASITFPEHIDHAAIQTLILNPKPNSAVVSPNVPVVTTPGFATMQPLGNSSSFKAKRGINTHWDSVDRAFYSDSTKYTPLLAPFGMIRDGWPGQVSGDSTIGARGWAYVIANSLKIMYISESTNFSGFSSHATNRSVMETAGAQSHIFAVECPNELDGVYGTSSSGLASIVAEINAFCSAWAGYPLVAPSFADWPNPALYQLFANDTRFTYGNCHSYMGVDWAPTDRQMAIDFSNEAIIVGSRPHIAGEFGHGTYGGGTGPGAGNPALTEAQQADSYVREYLDRDRYGYFAMFIYELGDETTTNDYETRLGAWHTDWTPKPSGTALINLASYYTGDPAVITPLPVQVTGQSSVTRMNLRQTDTGWNLAVWEQANTPPATTLSLTFDRNRSVVVTSIPTKSAVSSSASTSTVNVVSSATPTMIVIT